MSKARHPRLLILAILVAAASPPARAEVDPDTEVARRLFVVGRDLYFAGQYQKALEAFARARDAKPLPAFDFNIARCEDRLGHWPEALAAYERFAATATDAGDIREARARIPALRQRVKSAADRVAADEHYAKAISHFNAGHYAAAVDDFQLAWKAVPDPVYLYNQAQALRLAGDRRRAIAAYRSFLGEAPGTPLKNAVEVRIADLEKGGDAAPAAAATPVATAQSSGAASPAIAKPVAPFAAAPVKDAPSGRPSNAATLAAAAPAGQSERLKPVADLIKTNRAGFRACFDAWGKEHPGIGGKVTLSFYLDPDGVLNQVNAETKGFDSGEVSACMVRHARTLGYPAAPNGKFTRFNYPFDFKPN